MALSKNQAKILHVAKRQLALSEQEYRAVLREFGQVATSKDLDQAGFDRVMDRLAELGFESYDKQYDFGERRGMATPAQLGKIRRLWAGYMGVSDPKRLERWLQRSFGISALRFVDNETAHKAITALRDMARRGRR